MGSRPERRDRPARTIRAAWGRARLFAVMLAGGVLAGGMLGACGDGPAARAVDPTGAGHARVAASDLTITPARIRTSDRADAAAGAAPSDHAAKVARAVEASHVVEVARSRASDRASSYARQVESARREREVLAASWRSAGSTVEREVALDRAAEALQRVVVGLISAWDGTPYARDGVASRPGRDPIGCGFLVSTVLRGAGLRVERARLGQQAAEDIVLSLVPDERVLRERRRPLGRFLARVTAGGDGAYIVGLDRHVGFLIVEGGAAYFHHASHLAGGVIRERALLSPALGTSHYRVVGKLDDRALARAWLEGAAISTVSRGRTAPRDGSLD